MNQPLSKVNRNSSIELLRIFFILGIVLIHIYSHGSHLDVKWIYSLGEDWSTAYHLSIFSLGKMGVTGFVFVSGLYGIRMTKVRWIRMLAMCFTYYIVLSIIFGHYKGLYNTIHAWDQWWFLASYFLMCLLSPVIELAFDKFSKRNIQFIVIGLFVYTYVGHFLNMSNDHDFVIFLTIYVTARYISVYTPPIFGNTQRLLPFFRC